MRLTIALALVLIGFGVPPAAAQERLTLGLKWLPQAQFAGYYVALERGFYKAEKLQVTIKPGGSDPAPPEMLRSGAADVVVDWMPSALVARERGVPMVNVAQIFKRSGLWLTCRKDSGVAWPGDLKGRRVAVSGGGNELPFQAWVQKLGFKPDDVMVVARGVAVEPLVQRQADCASTQSYNEYWQMLDAGIDRDDLAVLKFDEHGVSTLEDGLYVLEPALADPLRRDRLARFLRATIKGWQYAITNPKVAVSTVMRAVERAPVPGAIAREKHQSRMMSEVAKLIDRDRIGWLDPADYERTVNVLMTGGLEPVIHARPEGAWTHAVWDQAKR